LVKEKKIEVGRSEEEGRGGGNKK